MNDSPISPPLVSVTDLTVTFGGRRPVHAVNGVSFTVGTGEVLGLLGESGCGKSVTLRSLIRLHPPKRTTYGGRIQIDGQDILAMSEDQLSRYRGSVTSMVFQEPLLAFDPVYTVGKQIAEAIRRHTGIDASAARTEAIRLLDRVQIPQAAERFQAYPHEMSGGMRQRAMIALALSCRPKLLLADEPTTALDATVQIQILLLLRELQREMGLSIIFVTHDIGVAVEISDRVAVMYAGRIIEQGPIAEIISAPAHPYTQGLLSSTVTQGMRGTRLEAIPGAPPDLAALPPGCAFAARCRYAGADCVESVPDTGADAGREVACFHPLPPPLHEGAADAHAR
ncbi:ABC transporter ATP-binding protein [Telmatospirillum sp.]|uniref:ABC transporter ATP-binding protein n=1 Tax=Telmatospirillum sp. TaxID=2079197 RepID=UPI002844D01A|nr:ABC transporter ATP-binding protein [Telmatospirillum sp.]MDR3436006.1 ABC transporter ATP-binding protein [Telmatospirillum sp.]